jgi:hypothetical protein
MARTCQRCKNLTERKFGYCHPCAKEVSKLYKGKGSVDKVARWKMKEFYFLSQLQEVYCKRAGAVG